MLMTKEINMNITNRNIGYYNKKGYQCKAGEIIQVNVFDIPKGSNYVVYVKCDICQKEIVQKEYYRYIKERQKINIDCCNNRECASKKQSLITRTPLEDVISYIEKEGYKFVDTVGEYKNSTSSLILECSNGHKLSYVINQFQQGRRCSICKGTYQNDHTFEEVFEYFESQGCQLLDEIYVSMKTPLNFICECGNYSKISYYDFLQGHRCKNCGGNKKHTYAEVIEFFNKNNCILLSKEYKNCKDLLDYKCSCGNQSKISLSNFLRGVRCNKCYRENNKGENHHKWNPNLTEEERRIKRNYEEYIIWRNTVFKRDNYICQVCLDDKGHNLNAHHLNGYNWCKEGRLDINNGITLCKNCHNDFHNTYGRGNNTEEQFNNWINT